MSQNWYVAASIVGKERHAAARLESRFEVFLPVKRIARLNYLGRIKDFYPVALFPGYFFVNCDPELRPLKHNEYRGLIGMGGAGCGEPLPLADEAVDELKLMANKDGLIQWPDLTPGVPVEIAQEGNYWGRRGLYQCKSGEDMVIVLLDAVVPFSVQVARSALRLAEVHQ